MTGRQPRDPDSIAKRAEARRRAWETRRAKYGPAGHAGSYSRWACTQHRKERHGR